MKTSVLLATLFGPYRPASLYAGGAPGIWLDWSDLGTLFQNSTATTPVAAAADPIGAVVDKSGRGNSVVQATDANRPAYAVSPAAATFDATNDALQTATISAGVLSSNMDCFIAVKRSTTAQVVLAYQAGGARFFGGVQDGSGLSATTSAGTPTYLVDGSAAVATRDGLDAALTVGVWHVLEVRNLDLSAWTSFALGGYGSGFNLPGSIAGVVMCSAQTDAVRSKIRRYLAAKVGISVVP